MAGPYLNNRPRPVVTRPTSLLDPSWNPADGIADYQPESYLDSLLGTASDAASSLVPHSLTDAAGFVPVVGEALSAKDAGSYGTAAVQAARSGRYGDALKLGGATGLSALGMLPMVAGVTRGLSRDLARGAAKSAGKDVARGLEGGAATGVGHNGAPENVLWGSADALDNVPVTWNGKPMEEWHPEDWKAVGDHVGIPNLGPLTKPRTFRYSDGAKFQIPGGLDGEFTYYDNLWLKANPVDPSRIPENLHAELQRKMVRSSDPMIMTGKPATPLGIFNSMLFGMTSPNNPLGPNQISAARLRVRSPEDVNRLADMVPWDVTDPASMAAVTKGQRNEASRRIARTFGVGAAPQGLGTRGSGDYTRIAELAQLWRKDPEWFRVSPVEAASPNGWADYVERLTTQVQGLGPKTGSFASVWQSPMDAAISAIDRHMVRNFRGQLWDNAEAENEWMRGVIDKWNAPPKPPAPGKKAKEPRPRADHFDDIALMDGGDGFIGEQLMNLLGARELKRNTVQGRGADRGLKPNPDLSQSLQDTQFITNPEKAQVIGAKYRAALRANAELADRHGLGLFASQWMYWDRLRRRLEPHENQWAGGEHFLKLPAPSKDQLRGVLDTMRRSGHLDYSKTVGPEGDPMLKPTRPSDANPSRYGYLSLPLAAAGAGAGAAGLGLLNDQEQ